MPSTRVCSPRIRRFPWRVRRLRMPAKALSGPALLGLWGLVSLLAAFLPRFYVTHRVNGMLRAWEEQAHETGKAVVQDWTQARPIPAFRSGDEAPLRSRLEDDPLLAALVDPATGAVWLRDGLRLRPPVPAEAASAARLAQWAGQAQAAGRSTWIPAVADNPRALQEATLALAVGPWWEFKVWAPSSRTAERFLERFSGVGSPARFALTRYDRDPAAGRMNAQGRPLSGDALSDRATRPTFSIVFPDLSLAFGEPWVVGLWGTDAQAHRAVRAIRAWRSQAWAGYAGFVGLLGLGCLAQLLAARRDRLRADKLAFLAHSLKTPLTILKLRCDTIRNANLPRDIQDGQVARIGDEVDTLVKVIEAGLEGVKPKSEPPPADPVDAGTFARLLEPMVPIFAEEGRTLALEAEPIAFRAPRRALEAALNTLLENALVHGRGAVSVRVRRRRRLVEVEVRDAGPGIPPARLSALPEAGADSGPSAPGHGMGLALLRRMALHEGWGLRFEAAEDGTGFSAVLELPGQARSGDASSFRR
ncbi:sensor histidine kinase [Mesoterricola sediminis]|uniref:histidine kinase n=1 Tax=Mesoterricola sediminis TaxID=2927980 RepID=A0AA48KAK0_9BACT|nr:HAMP domain-containing sensor histidine kinase [Mesoterricola sediminis]BDU75139.1 hypothetical protein METESE_00970 [Mesoterricola sediminis]